MRGKPISIICDRWRLVQAGLCAKATAALRNIPIPRIFLDITPKSVVVSAHPASLRGAYRDRQDMRGGDAVAAGLLALLRDDWRAVDGEIVWSWPPGAEVKPAALTSARVTGAREPVPGESTYKP